MCVVAAEAAGLLAVALGPLYVVTDELPLTPALLALAVERRSAGGVVLLVAAWPDWLAFTPVVAAV
jgi:hypothetical protein